MPTPSELEAQGQLVKIDAALEEWEQEFRCLYVHPRVENWFTSELPNLDADGFWESVQSPEDQAEDLVYRFVSGEDDIADLPPHSMQPKEAGVWELCTYDLRFFGWFWRKGVFIVSAVDTACRCKQHSLYAGYREQCVRDREGFDLTPPPFITGETSDVL